MCEAEVITFQSHSMGLRPAVHRLRKEASPWPTPRATVASSLLIPHATRDGGANYWPRTSGRFPLPRQDQRTSFGFDWSGALQFSWHCGGELPHHQPSNTLTNARMVAQQGMLHSGVSPQPWKASGVASWFAEVGRCEAQRKQTCPDDIFSEMFTDVDAGAGTKLCRCRLVAC